jgi:hypothetical protein
MAIIAKLRISMVNRKNGEDAYYCWQATNVPHVKVGLCEARVGTYLAWSGQSDAESPVPANSLWLNNCQRKVAIMEE